MRCKKVRQYSSTCAWPRPPSHLTLWDARWTGQFLL